MYSLIAVDGREVIKVNKNIVKSIRHKEFVDTLLNTKIMRHNMKIIQRTVNRITTYDVCKISLSHFDHKRYILGDGINSLAFFIKI